jgi:hypothetical protein
VKKGKIVESFAEAIHDESFFLKIFYPKHKNDPTL